MEIKAPDLGVESAEVSEILVSVGDVISENDDIVLLESDKAAVEVPSPSSGTVSKIVVSVGDSVSEGSVLIELEEGGSGSSDASDDSQSETEDEESDSAESEAESPSVENEVEEDSNADDSDDEAEAASGEAVTHALPDLGVDEAEVAEVMVSVGDSVEEGDAVLLIESDKASVEVPSPATGVVEEILIAAGDNVANGQDFIVITGAAKSSGTTKKDTNKKGDSKAEAASLKKESAKKESAATDNKASSKASSAKSNSAKSGNAQQSKLSESEVNTKLTEVYAGPAVRKLARQLGVDITQVGGSALNERILKEDVFDYVKSHMQQEGTAKPPSGAANVGSGLPTLPDMSNAELWGEIETQDLSRLQKVSIPQLNYNTYLPQVTQFDLSDITETEKLRGELKGEFKAQGIGLTILAFIVKATAYALMQHPKFNSHLSDDNTQIHIRKTVNMGIAVATDDGLIVPVLKNAQDKGIKQIAIEIGELAAKARDKKLTAKDLQGASFTISSQGNLGGTYFTPLVNWPQVGILGISEATMQPRWDEEKQTFKPRLMLPLSLSYDHRVINGADAAVFTRYIAKLLADPRRILI